MQNLTFNLLNYFKKNKKSDIPNKKTKHAKLPTQAELYLEYINQKNLQLIASGAFKDCYSSPYTDKVYLVFKQNTPEKLKQYTKEVKSQTTQTLKLKKLNVTTPKVFGGFTHNQKVVMVQEKAKGTPVFISSLETAKKMFNLTSENCTEKELHRIVYKFNLNSQQELVNLPQHHYNKLIKDLLILSDLDINVHDGHAENLMFDPSVGFNLIDLPIEGFGFLKSNLFLMLTTLNFFTSYYHRYKERTSSYFIEHSKLTLPIIEKVISAFSNNNLTLREVMVPEIDSFIKNTIHTKYHSKVTQIIEQLKNVKGK